MIEELVLAIFRLVAGIGAGYFILVGMVMELWMEYERMRKRGE